MERYLTKFDWLILKPALFLLLGASTSMLFHADWLIAGEMLLLAVFGVGGIGQSLHRKRSGKELFAGGPEPPGMFERITPPIDEETLLMIGQATVRLGLVGGCAIGIISFHFGVRWYIALFAAIFSWWMIQVVVLFLFSSTTFFGPRPTK